MYPLTPQVYALEMHMANGFKKNWCPHSLLLFYNKENDGTSTREKMLKGLIEIEYGMCAKLIRLYKKHTTVFRAK